MTEKSSKSSKFNKVLLDSPIVSVKEARKILGNEANGMLDEEIALLVNSYDEITTLIFKNYEILKTSET